jgi:hypothetical protein
LFLSAIGMGVLAIAFFAMGVHALIHGRMPGRRLQAAVRFPRLWGVGALLVVVALGLHSAWLLGVAVGIVIIGHVAKRAV